VGGGGGDGHGGVEEGGGEGEGCLVRLRLLGVEGRLGRHDYGCGLH